MVGLVRFIEFEIYKPIAVLNFNYIH